MMDLHKFIGIELRKIDLFFLVFMQAKNEY